MLLLLRTCFRGYPKQWKEVPLLEEGNTYQSQAGDCAGPGNGLLSEPSNFDSYEQEDPTHQLVYKNGLPAHCHAGGHAGLYSPHDVWSYRTGGIAVPSFTLSAIAEDDTDEQDICDPDHGVTAGRYPVAGEPAMTRGSGPGMIAAKDDGCSESELSFYCDFIASEQHAFAIMPPAPLSTVFEEEAGDTDEGRYAPSGSCHSAEAGCGSDHTRLSVSDLVRGLSAPACATTLEPPGATGSGGCAPAEVACTAGLCSPSPPAQTTLTKPQVSPSGSTAGTCTAVTQWLGSGDPIAMWYR